MMTKSIFVGGCGWLWVVGPCLFDAALSGTRSSGSSRGPASFFLTFPRAPCPRGRLPGSYTPNKDQSSPPRPRFFGLVRGILPHFGLVPRILPCLHAYIIPYTPTTPYFLFFVTQGPRYTIRTVHDTEFLHGQPPISVGREKTSNLGPWEEILRDLRIQQLI